MAEGCAPCAGACGGGAAAFGARDGATVWGAVFDGERVGGALPQWGREGADGGGAHARGQALG